MIKSNFSKYYTYARTLTDINKAITILPETYYNKDFFKIEEKKIEQMNLSDLFKLSLKDNSKNESLLTLIEQYKKNIKITFIDSAIMNQLSYHVSKKKLSAKGLSLNSNLDRDIANTLKLFKNIKK